MVRARLDSLHSGVAAWWTTWSGGRDNLVERRRGALPSVAVRAWHPRDVSIHDSVRLTDTVTVTVRSYFSGQHLWAAEHFARLAEEFEQERAGERQILLQHRAYVMAVVMESVAFLEAFVNELLQDCADGASSATGGLSSDVIHELATYWADHDRDGTLVKYRMARLLATGQDVDTGRRPHDDVKYLIKFRNWLVHYQPRDIGQESPAKVIDHVRGRFDENPFLDPGGAAWFPDYALSASCARWTISSVRAYAKEFCEAIGSTRTQHLDEHDEKP